MRRAGTCFLVAASLVVLMPILGFAPDAHASRIWWCKYTLGRPRK